MLNKITFKETITTRAAMEKYRTKHFIMIITEVVDYCDNDLGFVIYTADNRRELNQVPRDEYIGQNAAFMLGIAAEPYPMVGNVVFHDKT